MSACLIAGEQIIKELFGALDLGSIDVSWFDFPRSGAIEDRCPRCRGAQRVVTAKEPKQVLSFAVAGTADNGNVESRIASGHLHGQLYPTDRFNNTSVVPGDICVVADSIDELVIAV